MVNIITVAGALVTVCLIASFPVINSIIARGELDGQAISFIILSGYSVAFLYANLSGNLLYGQGKIESVIDSTVIGLAVTGSILIFAWSFPSIMAVSVALLLGVLANAFRNNRALSDYRK